MVAERSSVHGARSVAALEAAATAAVWDSSAVSPHGEEDGGSDHVADEGATALAMQARKAARRCAGQDGAGDLDALVLEDQFAHGRRMALKKDETGGDGTSELAKKKE